MPSGRLTACFGTSTKARLGIWLYTWGMDLTETYERAAPSWSRKALSLGYPAAYGELFSGRVLHEGAVLDVGSGTGTFAQAWTQAGGSKDLTLLDPSRAMLRYAQQAFAADGLDPAIAECGIEEFQSDKTYDAVLASHVLEHFNDPSATMGHLANLVTPGGRLYLVVSKPHWCNWLIWIRFRHRWFHPQTIRDLACGAGLAPLWLQSFSAGPPSRTSLGYIFSKR